MFSRNKRRSLSNPPPQRQANPTPSASTAAALAFIKKQNDDASLSSNAAAAALRASSVTPTRVGDIQTKRMVRRASNSSITSAPPTSSRPPFGSQLQRRGSNGSMSQRSFRSPSPGPQAPPVPALPRNVSAASQVPPVPSKSAKRASSLEPSSRVSVQAQQAPARQPSTATNVARAGSTDAAKKTVVNTQNVQPQSPKANQGSPRSINFSRPMSPPLSPSAYANPNVKKGPAPQQGQPRTARARPASSLGFSQSVDAPQIEPAPMTKQRQVSDNTQTTQTTHVSSDAHAGAALNAAVRPQSSQSVRSPPPARSNTTSGRQAAARPISMVEPDRPFIGVDMATRRVIPGAFPTSDKPLPSKTGLVSRSESSAQAPARSQSQRVVPGPSTQSPGQSPGSYQPGSTYALPSPSDDQIKKFQTRAASMLARPLTTDPTPPAVEKQASKPEANKVDPVPDSPSTSATLSPPGSVSMVLPTKKTTVIDKTKASGLQRAPSSSPARSAHFSDSPVVEPIKHAPPPRAISPAKSAMKSPSPRPSSPEAPGLTRDISDMSDSRSLISDDSTTPSTKKKRKSARVSFEERPIMVGESASSESPTQTVMSPQYKRLSHTSSLVEEDGTGMTPRPVLPSFGSVRGRKNVVETTDLARDGSDTLPVADEHGAAAPEITVHPATPHLEDNEKEFGTLSPGESHRESRDLEDVLSAADVGDVLQSHPKPVEEEEEEGAHAIGVAHSYDPGHTPEEQTDNENESDEEFFSDAAEDASEIEEGPGFASLDAIVESPEGSPIQNRGVHAEEAALADAHAETSDHTGSPGKWEDWEAVRSYWSSLSDKTKQEMEKSTSPQSATEALQEQVEAPEEEEVRQRVQSKGVLKLDEPGLPPWPDKQFRETSKSNLASVPVAAAPEPVVEPAAKTTSKPATKPAAKAATKPSSMRKSMRESDNEAAEPNAKSQAAVEPVHMRKSMRSSGTLQTSMRTPYEPPPRPAPVKMSASTEALLKRSTQNRETRQQVNSDVASAEAIALARNAMPANRMTSKPGHDRNASLESDASGSSFRKGRKDDSDKMTMRRSMRGMAASTPPQQPAPSSSKPPRSFRGEQPKKESKRFSIMGKSKKPAKEKSSSKSSGSRFTSRFADSSDESGDEMSNWRSKFEVSDSSDDDEPPQLPPIKLTPVRGIPRKSGQEEGDSTDLSDASDAEGKANKARPATPPTGVLLGKVSGEAERRSSAAEANGTTSQVLNRGTMRKTDGDKESNRRSGFFGLGGKKKVTDTQPPSSPKSPPKAQSIKPAEDPATPERPSSRMSKTLRTPPSQQRAQSPQSIRSRFMRRLSISSNPGPETKPMVEDFPYPPPPIPDEYRQEVISPQDRPMTSDGVSASESRSVRPALGGKRESSMTAPVGSKAVGGKLQKQREPIVSERTGKKKKFQGLRRAFGLKD